MLNLDMCKAGEWLAQGAGDGKTWGREEHCLAIELPSSQGEKPAYITVNRGVSSKPP